LERREHSQKQKKTRKKLIGEEWGFPLQSGRRVGEDTKKNIENLGGISFNGFISMRGFYL